VKNEVKRMEQNKALNMFSLQMKKELKKLNPVCVVVKTEENDRI